MTGLPMERSKPDPAAVKDLFYEILERRASGEIEEASRRLREANLEVRAAVEKLLEAHDRASGALLDDAVSGAPAARSGTASSDKESTPTIAGYEVAEEIGRGGFGIVYRAHQRTPIDRPVAIKVLRHELVSTQLIERFRAESAMLARMNHESIAKVYDAGISEQGQPFVAMELIDGMPLNVACDAYKLDAYARFELMARVCDAVQHAHQRVVIHRDLKPANILVEKHHDGFRPRVIDFGIAKLLDADPSDPSTQASVRLGTPRYMSPEQRDGTNAADTRVDVYALGAMLCELLAGDVPTSTDGDQKSTLRSDTDSSRVTKPSRIASEMGERSLVRPRTLRGDIDRIVLKACAPDLDQRYPSAQALADDLRNYIAGRPIHATQPGMLYVTRKFVRRHRASVSLASVLGVALLVTMGVAAIKWREASIERDKALASTNRVAFIGDFLLEMLLLSADHNARGAPPILTESAMKDIADRAKSGLADDPEHMLPMLVGIGRFQTQSGYALEGTDTLREALGFAIEHHGIPSVEVVELRVHLHDELWGHGIDGFKEQIALADQESALLFKDNDPRRLRIRQRADDSIDNLNHILELYKDMDGVEPFDRYHALFALNMKYRFSQHPEEQLDITRRLYEVARSYYPADHSATIDAMALYGDAMSVYAPSQESIELLKNAYDMAVPKYGYDHFTTESIRRGLARIYGKLGRPAEGIPYALADVESAERSNGSTSFQYANALFELGRLYQYTKQYGDAQQTIAKTLALRKNQWPQGHAQIVVAQVVLAQLEYELGEYDTANELIDEIFPYIQDRRSASTYAAANSVRISICLKRGDDAGAEVLRQTTRQHLADLGLTPEMIEEVMGN